MQKSSNLIATLRTLCENGVQFIVVGGLAAVLNGAPIQTYDLDLVYSREPANIRRLLLVLESIDASFRIQPERHLRPNLTHLSAGGPLNLLTRYGPLDLLAAIGQNLAYQDLLSQSAEMDIGEGIRVRVLNLETLICLKEQRVGKRTWRYSRFCAKRFGKSERRISADLLYFRTPAQHRLTSAYPAPYARPDRASLP